MILLFILGCIQCFLVHDCIDAALPYERSGAPETILTLAGSNVPPASITTAQALSVYLNEPQGLFVLDNNDYYVADTDNNVIRYAEYSTGLMSVVAGDMSITPHENVYAVQTGIKRPTCVWVGTGYVYSSILFYFVDLENGLVRKVSTNGIVNTVVGYRQSKQCSGEKYLLKVTCLCRRRSMGKFVYI